jgi:hypothetical protein
LFIYLFSFDVHGSVQRTSIFKYNQQHATLHNVFISVKCSTCFRRVLRPSSGAQNCIYSIGYCQALLLPVAVVGELELKISITCSIAGGIFCARQIIFCMVQLQNTDCLNYLVNKAILVHNFFGMFIVLLYLFRRLCAHHQEKQLFLCDTVWMTVWYAYQTVIHTE